MRRIAKFRYMLILILSVSIPFFSYYFYMEEQGNFHVVTSGQFYRSAQLDEDELIHYIKKYHIKSILNLRGKKENARWYGEEIAICQKMGVIHYNYGISSTHKVDNKGIDSILNILINAPKPLLIHCRAGADRSGLISAIWEYAVEGKSAKESAKQLSPIYLHFPYFGIKTKAMDESFWRFVRTHKR